jgi:(p)ppGpp synthase/HD superfamily hydrolase
MTSLYEKALILAIQAHEGQVRKTDGSPYIAHPIMVAHLLTEYRFSETVVAAGLLHDVLEDTTVSKETLRRAVGDDVVEIVLAVTEDLSVSWEERKAKYIEKVRDASENAKAVSIADKIHNASSLIEAYQLQGESVWSTFTKERKQKCRFEDDMLAMFRASWKHPLVDIYAELVGKINELV